MAEDKHMDMTDAEEMRKVFEVLSEHIPRLLESVTKVLYPAQGGEKFGNSLRTESWVTATGSPPAAGMVTIW